MSKLYRLVIEPNMVEKKTTTYHDSRYSEREISLTDTKIVQEGWKVSKYEREYDFSQIEERFSQAWNKIKEGTRELGLININVNVSEPSSVTIRVGDGYTSNRLNTQSIIISEGTEEFVEEKVWVFVREGMSTNIQVSNQDVAELEAPTKSNNKSGLTVRGYACSLIQDDAIEDRDFYISILERFNEK